MKPVTNNFFRIIETTDTPVGKMHCIAWKWLMTKRFLRNISKEAISLGWMQSGDFAIKNIGKKTNIFVSERIIKDFVAVLEYLAKRYGD